MDGSEMKACTKCGVVKPLEMFNRRATSSDGRKNICRSCQSSENARRYAANPDVFKAAARAYEAANREVVLGRKKRYYQVHRERLLAQFAKHCKTNRVARSAYRRAYAKANPEKERASATAYRLRNLDRVAARVALRHARKLRATPPWADEAAIKEIYSKAKNLTKKTGVDWHVDHIVPLRSPLVCGLHCEANLQPLPAKINVAKSNARWPDMPE